MIIFWRLLLAHLLTDFTFQIDKIADWKRKSVYGVLVHSSIFLVLSLVLTWQYLGETWWKFIGLVSVALLFLIHCMEDYYRVWGIKRAASQDNILFFLWDQFVHIALIFLFSPYDKGKLIEEKFIVILILAIFVTHLATILIYYLEQMVYGKGHFLIRFKNKHYLIVERFMVFLCLFLPGLWWISFIIVLLFCQLFNRKLKLEFTKFNVVVGNIFAIFAGILGRVILY